MVEPKAKKSLGKRILRWTLRSIVFFFAFTIAWVVLYKWINPPTTYLHLTCDCSEKTTFHKEWVDSEQISRSMKLAVVASEDNNFMKHGGIDWGAVEKAKKYNETTGKKKGKYRGASTITQQTAKNVFLWPGTSKISKWIRKGFEVYFTYLIEFIWGKERIMEVYLNVIEVGECKFGVEAAAQDYFGKTAMQLSREEAAIIAGCLPNPIKYNVAKPGNYLKKRQSQIAKLMRLIGDNYFERYESNIADEDREKEEKEQAKKIESLPESEVPTATESDEGSSPEETQEVTPETPATEENNAIELQSGDSL
jgi:monofunctional biosynthetic peptidoglycan transglycosylase